MDKFYYIYKTTCLVNGKIYIGQRGCDCLPEEDVKYLGSGIKFRSAIKKYNVENFIKQILVVCEEYQLDDIEIYFIKHFNSKVKSIGYNLTNGGKTTRGLTISEHGRKNMSRSRKGSKKSKSSVEKSRISRIGLKRSEEQRLKMSLSQKGKKHSDERKNAHNLKRNGRCYNKGYRHTEESKKIMSLIKKGKPSPRKGIIMSEEQKLKISIANKGKESPNKGRKKSQAVIEINRNSHCKFLYRISVPNGDIQLIKSIPLFCKENNLTRHKLMATLYGINYYGKIINEYNGYKIISRELLNKTTV